MIEQWAAWCAKRGLSFAQFAEGIKLLNLDTDYYARNGWSALERAVSVDKPVKQESWVKRS